MRATRRRDRLGAAGAALMMTLAPACGGGTTGAAVAEIDPPLDDAAFSKPWVVIDRVASGKSILTVARGPEGFVVITTIPTFGEKTEHRVDILALSTDGVNWSEQQLVPDGNYRSVAFGAGRFVAVGDEGLGESPGTVISSPDGRNWTHRARTATALVHVRYTPAGFTAVGAAGVVLVSTDGIDWRASSIPGATSIWDATWGGGRFVAVGDQLATAVDGMTWSRIPCGANLSCKEVQVPSGGTFLALTLNVALFGNGAFLATGLENTVRSTDGLVWTSAGAVRDRRLIFAGGYFLELTAADRDDARNLALTVSASTDGAAWQPRTTAVPVRTDDTCATKRCLVFPNAIVLVP